MSGLVIAGLRLPLAGSADPRSIALKASAGELVALVGPQAAGKTAVLDWACGLAPAWPGRLTLGGLALHGLPPHRRVRAGLARSDGSPGLGGGTVFDLLMMAARGDMRTIRAAVQRAGLAESAASALAELGPEPAVRLDLARALCVVPQALLVDDPFRRLGAEAAGRIGTLIRSLADGGLAVVVTLPRLAEAYPLADRIVVMAAGRIVTEGPPGEVAVDPLTLIAWRGTPEEADD